MRLILLLLGTLSAQISFSQSLSSEILTSSGDYFTSANNSLSWTIGESITETYSNASYILTQGFQQSFYTITSVEENPNTAFSVVIYPNPASSFINIRAESLELRTGQERLRKMNFELLDIAGKLILSEIFQNNVQINISEYTNSAYILHVYDENRSLTRTLKLQKIN